MVRQIKKVSVSDLVYQNMLEMIINGVWKEGDGIPSENILSEQYGVSRDSVRQAIHKLSALGLVETRHGKGTTVQKLDVSFYMNMLVPSILLNGGDTKDVIEFMKCIQAESARIASRSADEEQLAELHRRLYAMEENSTYEEYLRRDMAFHHYLCEISGNSLFVKAVDVIEVLLHEVFKNRIVKGGNEVSISQHAECYEAIRMKDEERAAKSITDHYDYLLKEIRQMQNGSREE